MPGPRMGSRPADFDEEVVRKAPTFQKWLTLTDGQKIRYACRDFVKGHGDDEERLMRRIMIARRNNLRDHETLKRARAADPERQVARGGRSPGGGDGDGGASSPGATTTTTPERKTRRRRVVIPTSSSSPGGTGGGSGDTDVMDEPAVEATRSYRAWLALEDGREFTYNQKYVKGREGHDHLLRKNIWRRMRYRRENKRMVERMKAASSASGSMSVAALAAVKSEGCGKGGEGSPTETITAMKTEDETANQAAAAVVGADITASEKNPNEPGVDQTADGDKHAVVVKTEDEETCDGPPMVDATTIQIDGSALDAAAKLAAAAASTTVDDTSAAIEKSLAEAVAAAGVVATTGGGADKEEEEEEKLTAV